MTLVKHISLIFKSLLTFTALFGLLFAAVHYMNLSFTLDGARRILAEQIQTYTGRDVRIDGDVELSISLFPQLLVQQIHISNPDGFNDDEDFVTVSEVRVDVSLVALLSGQLHLSDISADQAKINLIEKKDGSLNWSFENPGQSSKLVDTNTAGSDSRTSGTNRLSMGEFRLTKVALHYRDETRDQVIDTQLEQLTIDVKDRANPTASIRGNVQGHRYDIIFESEPLETFLSGNPWLIHGTGHIADRQTKLEAAVQSDVNKITGNIDITVININLGMLLDTLGIITGQDAVTDNINIKARVTGSDLVELYEQAKVDLQLGRGYWNLQSVETGQKKKLSFTKASSFTSWKKPVALHIDGTIAGESIKLDFTTNRLEQFFDDIQKLNVDLVAGVAGIDITLNGALDLPIETKKLNLEISVKGKDLEKLNPIIDTEFPPFNDFSLTGNIISNKKGYILKSANASIGDSQFQTSIVIETNSPKPLWHINLNSQQLQLKDFGFDDWDIKQPATATGKDTKKVVKNKSYLEPLRHLEDLVKTTDMHLDLNLKVDNVLSGKDHLGKARFQLHIRNDTVHIENLIVEIPGGSISASLSLIIDDNEATGHVTLDIDKLDYGISTRLFQPGSQVDGIISTRVDLELGGSDFTRLFDQATGNMDIAVWPKNTRPAKALNLWTTNLYLILLPELKKKESLVNCMVGLMNLEDGTMREEFLALDTTKLWINGNINADFKQEYVKLSLFPQSKTARLFSFQSPIRVEGNFSDIGMAINPVDLTGSYISFITSPLHVPARWIFGDRVPADGSAICERLFDREYVEKLNAELEIKRKDELEEMLQSD